MGAEKHGNKGLEASIQFECGTDWDSGSCGVKLGTGSGASAGADAFVCAGASAGIEGVCGATGPQMLIQPQGHSNRATATGPQVSIQLDTV